VNPDFKDSLSIGIRLTRDVEVKQMPKVKYVKKVSEKKE